MNKNVRLTKDSSALLDELTNLTSLSKTEIVSRALEQFKRDLFFKSADKIYKNLSDKELQEESVDFEQWEKSSLIDVKDN